MKKARQRQWIAILITATIWALLVGNLIEAGIYGYMVPGINLDVSTFVDIFGWAIIVALAGWITKTS